jgi:hypothetical protein
MIPLTGPLCLTSHIEIARSTAAECGAIFLLVPVEALNKAFN